MNPSVSSVLFEGNSLYVGNSSKPSSGTCWVDGIYIDNSNYIVWCKLVTCWSFVGGGLLCVVVECSEVSKVHSATTHCRNPK
jgi:hypothetical protein